MDNNLFQLADPYEIARVIKAMPKKTPVKAYVQGNLSNVQFTKGKQFGGGGFYVLFGDWKDVSAFLDFYKDRIALAELEWDRRNSAIPLLDIKKENARIEPGAVVREGVFLGEGCIIMMGAVVNMGAKIGAGSMVDMNAVIGARAIIGERVHVGAGAVLAGVLEPPSANPVRISDRVVIGANAVILEGVAVGRHSVVAAGSVVTKDVPPDVVVAGTPASVIKRRDKRTDEKTRFLDDLR